MNVVIPGLTIVKTANTSAAVPGQAVGYTVTITDSGQTSYTGAVVTDDLTGVLDDAVYDGDAVATAGSVQLRGPGADLDGEPVAGGLGDDHLLGHRRQPRHRRHHLLVNTVASSAAGSSCPPGTTSGPLPGHGPGADPALTIVKTASTATAVPGQTVTYTIAVTDSGQTPYTGAALTDSLAGVLGDAAYNNDAAATVGSVSYAAPNLTWTGDLSPGGSATITYSVTVNNPDTGGHVLTNTVTSTTPGSNCRAGERRPAVHRDGDGVAADDRLDAERGDGHARGDGDTRRPRSPTPGRPRITGSASASPPRTRPTRSATSATRRPAPGRCRSGRAGRCGPGTSRSAPR